MRHMRCINKIILVGVVGRDPDVSTYHRRGYGLEKMALFSLATPHEVWNAEKEQSVTVTEWIWHRITAYGRHAEIAERFIRKGHRVYIEGRMEYDSYEKNGVTIPTAEVVVTDLAMIAGAPDEDGLIVETQQEQARWDRVYEAAPFLLDACVSILNVEGAAEFGAKYGPAFQGLNVAQHFDKVRNAIRAAGGVPEQG